MGKLTPPSVFIEPWVRCYPRIRIFKSPTKSSESLVRRNLNIHLTVGGERKAFVVCRRVIDISVPPPMQALAFYRKQRGSCRVSTSTYEALPLLKCIILKRLTGVVAVDIGRVKTKQRRHPRRQVGVGCQHLGQNQRDQDREVLENSHFVRRVGKCKDLKNRWVETGDSETECSNLKND